MCDKYAPILRGPRQYFRIIYACQTRKDCILKIDGRFLPYRWSWMI